MIYTKDRGLYVTRYIMKVLYVIVRVTSDKSTSKPELQLIIVSIAYLFELPAVSGLRDEKSVFPHSFESEITEI